VTAQVPLLAIERLKVVFQGERGRTTHAVDAVDLTLMRGTTLGIVGESGCGKSVTALAIMGLLSRTGAVSGVVRFDGTDLIRLPPARMRDLRGNRLAMIFQEPMTSLNPSYTIGEQIIESLMRHLSIELLRRVHIPSPEERIDDHPHKLSGGMRQRAMIAMALACGPELLIADEPTTALDVTIQAQILDLLRELRRENRISIILITHDLGVVAEICDEVAVMYAGEVVERAPAGALFDHPAHPYTVGLLGSLPRLDGEVAELAAIEGMVADMSALPAGCRFAPRCPFADDRCRHERPPVVMLEPKHWSRCFYAPLEKLV